MTIALHIVSALFAAALVASVATRRSPDLLALAGGLAVVGTGLELADRNWLMTAVWVAFAAATAYILWRDQRRIRRPGGAR